jgi:hypothetical protein
MTRQVLNNLEQGLAFRNKLNDNFEELFDKADQVVSVKDFGAVGNGTADDTAAIQAAIAAADTVFFPAGTYRVTGLTVPRSGMRLFGAGRQATIIRLANAANNHVIFADALSGRIDNVTITDLTIDGNKANQSIGTGNNWRGLYMLGECAGWHVARVHITSTVDHGLHVSDGGVSSRQTGENSLFLHCEATNCGSQAHLDAGGAGGTGFAGTSAFSGRFVACYASGNHLNGFKGVGVFVGCRSYSNGSGFESGFTTPIYIGTTYLGCEAADNVGDGWRHLGQIENLQHIGCTAARNGGNGISLVNTAKNMLVSGCMIFNNGQSGAARTISTGLDGIGVLSTSTTGPTRVTITGCHIYDDQAVKTQQAGIYIDDGSVDLYVAPDNQMTGNATHPLQFTAAAKSASAGARVLPFGGSTALARVTAPATITGSTSEQTFTSHVVSQAEQFDGREIRVYAAGRVTGTAGTKIVRFNLNGSAIVISSQLAGETQRWACDLRISRFGTSAFVTGTVFENGGTRALVSEAYSISLATDLTITTRAQLGDAADSVIQDIFVVQ